jgi:alanyl-tRNA synthetase
VNLEEAVASLGGSDVLSGDAAFRLYDTYGFPVDMTEDILRSRGIRIDREGFERALEEQRSRARGAQADKQTGGDYTLLVAAAKDQGGVEFAGSFEVEAQSEIVGLSAGGPLVPLASEGDDIDLVVKVTPFYGESGGQIGDKGTATTASGAVIDIVDTQKPSPDVIVHRGRVRSGEVATGDSVTLSIDAVRRQAIRLNHSSTHLLNAALRNHLGAAVHQAGSLVEATRLRFDFNHDGPVSDAVLADVEAEVNEQVRANLEVSTEEMPYDDAIAAGALAFFGDKYGEVVRVVRMGGYSVELCGGTHVARTGDIGVLQITSETGVAAGVRRIEAVTGLGALARVRKRDALLRELTTVLRAPEDKSVEKVEKLLEQIRELERRVEKAAQSKSGDVVADAIAGARDQDGAKIVVARVDGVDSKSMRGVSDQVRDKIGSGVVVLAAKTDSGAAVTVAVTKDCTDRFHAGNIVKEIASLVDGRGGGKPDFAQAGGKNPDGIPALLEKANELVSQ